MTGPNGPVVREVDAREAERLVRGGRVRVLDVRTPVEYAELGHIPDALLLPSNLIAAAPATLPTEGKPLLVVCEPGIRSAHAARFLAQAGYDGVANLVGGMSRWTGPRQPGAWDHRVPVWPSTWLVENGDLLPPGGRALDLACGAGRNALLLAAAGFAVRAVDRDERKIAPLRSTAARLKLPVDVEVLDLETPGLDLGTDQYDLILGVHYLHRPLFDAVVRALAPGGLLLYETFTVEQASRGKPTNPAFLLERGELRRLVAPLKILRQREGEFEGRMVAAVAAQKERVS